MPSGIWASEEYEKLRRYDNETHEQPASVFQCHQNDAASPASRIGAGWVGRHDAIELLALRLVLASGGIDAGTYQEIVEYVSPVPLFTCGADAADHGQAEINHPGPGARRLIRKITRVRGDIPS